MAPNGEYKMSEEVFCHGKVVYLEELLNVIITYSVEILAGLLAVFILLYSLLLVRLNNKLKAYKQLTKLLKGGSLEDLILELDKQAQTRAGETQQLSRKIKALEDELASQPHNWSLERFNAFGSTGGDLSFSLAVVNDAGDGYVLSSLYGREESRMYAKPLCGGKSTYTLSDEEKKAIQSALKGNK